MSIKNFETISPAGNYYDLRDQLKWHVYHRSEQAFIAGDNTRDSIRTRRNLLERQKYIRKVFLSSIGGLPNNSPSLNPKVTGIIHEKGFRIEKIVFEPRPKAYITANLYVPDNRTSPGGAVLFLCGHGYEAKGYPQYQIECRTLVNAGLVVLIMDPLGQGERMGYYEPTIKRTTVTWGTYEHDYVGSQCLPMGDNLARYFLHDAIRGLDYILTRPEVDPDKIGVTGSSGGGTQTCMMMISDPRIAAAAPGKFVTNRREYMMTGGVQDCEQIWFGITAAGIDHEDFLLMMAPKPVRLLAVKYDFFPIEGTRRTLERARRFWALYGKRENVDIVEDANIHDSKSVILARAKAEFFTKHLLGMKFTPQKEGTDPIDPAKLWCTQSGQIRGDFPKARFIFEENQDRLKTIKKSPATRRKKKGLIWLKQTVFAHRQPCDPNLRLYSQNTATDINLQMGIWWSQTGIFNHAAVFRDARFQNQTLPVTLAVWDQGTQSLKSHELWIRQTCQQGQAVMVLDVTGVGAIKPNPISHASPEDRRGTNRKLNDDLIWLGDSLAAMRVYDVLRAIEIIKIWPGLKTDNLQFYAYGLQGLYAQLAASLDKHVRKIKVENGIESIAKWVTTRHYDMFGTFDLIIPGILQHLDLPNLK